MRRAAVLPVALAVLATAEMLSVRPSGWVLGLALELLACLVLAGR
jgi:hypothetical protein